MGATGLKPAASCVTGRRSKQLNQALAYLKMDCFPPIPSDTVSHLLVTFYRAVVLEWKGKKRSLFMPCGAIVLLRMCLKEFRSASRKRRAQRPACCDVRSLKLQPLFPEFPTSWLSLAGRRATLAECLIVRSIERCAMLTSFAATYRRSWSSRVSRALRHALCGLQF